MGLFYKKNWKEKIVIYQKFGKNYMQYILTLAKQILVCPVGWGCRIYRLLLWSVVSRPPTSILDMEIY